MFSIFPKKLRERGWIVPAYTMPPNTQSVAVMRIVVKERRHLRRGRASTQYAECDR